MTPQEAILKLNDLQKQIIFGDIAKVILTMAEDHAKAQTTLRERTREAIGEEFASDVYRLEAERDALQVELSELRASRKHWIDERDKVERELTLERDMARGALAIRRQINDRLHAQLDRCLCDGVKEKAWHLVCGACWNKLPVEMRDEVFAALNEGEGSNRHLIAKDACMEFLWAAGVAFLPKTRDEEQRPNAKLSDDAP